MLGNKLINTNAGGGCTNTVDLYNPFPDGGGVALYQLNGDATDVSGNYDGTATNVTYGTGEFGQAGIFNGSSSYVKLNSLTTNNTSDYTFSFWCRNVVAPSSGYSLFITATVNDYIYLAVNPSGQLVYYFDNYLDPVFPRYAPTLTTTGVDLSTSEWKHVVFRIEMSTGVKIYVNNIEVLNYAQPSTLRRSVSEGTSAVIGAAGTPTSAFLNGELDQVRIFSRALRPYEVEALYTEEYCTPTIVPSEHFNTVTFTGDGSAKSIADVGFEPDLVWWKNRGNAAWHQLHDSVRGAGNRLFSNSTSATQYDAQSVTSFDALGFSIGTSSDFTGNCVAWNFKAGGAAVTNTDGTITSQVSANVAAGFSVVEYTAGGTANVGHGLDSAPAVIITKNLDAAEQWFVYHKDVGTQKFLGLNTTSAAISNSGVYTSITDNTFTNLISGTSRTYINYCFAEVEGFSSFGSYVGNAGSNSIVTGFEPAFVMIKKTSGTGDWFMHDNKRLSASGFSDLYLAANLSAAEVNSSDDDLLRFNSNGFTLNTTFGDYNASGSTYIYMAFAADPTTVEPTLEDSFNTVLYTGNGGTQTIGGVFEGGGSFNGSSSYIDTNYSLPASSNSSFSFWFTVDTTSTKFLAGQTGDSSNYFHIASVSSANKIEIQIGSVNYVQLTVPNMADGNWHHLVISRSAGSGYTAYLDNSNVGTFSNTAALSSSNFFLGARDASHTSSLRLLGSIDQVRIFNTALTAAQVTELYEETDADSSVCDFPSGAGGIALYELNGNANDACGTYNGTATNVTWLNNGTGFQPDLVWIKGRTFADNHNLADSVRGAEKYLFSNLTSQEFTSPNYLTSFNNNGFTVGSDNSSNKLNEDFVAWAWKGAEIPAINSNGSITSVVSANPAAGFSIVSYTGIGPAATVGHGLLDTPSVVIVKNRQDSRDWVVWHKDLAASSYLILNSTSAQITDTRTSGGQPRPFGPFTPTTFGVNIDNETGYTNNYIAYCFAEVAGFSKFGSYTGNGNAAGPTINCGFEPGFVMIKASSAGGTWAMHDNKRGNYNNGDIYARLSAEDAAAEYDGYPTDKYVEFSATGFQITNTSNSWNGSGRTYIYMAFANQF